MNASLMTYGSAAVGPVEIWLDRDEALLRLRLDRPKANIIDSAMVTSFAQAFAASARSHPTCPASIS